MMNWRRPVALVVQLVMVSTMTAAEQAAMKERMERFMAEQKHIGAGATRPASTP
jgi:hypothetical protein